MIWCTKWRRYALTIECFAHIMYYQEPKLFFCIHTCQVTSQRRQNFHNFLLQLNTCIFAQSWGEGVSLKITCHADPCWADVDIWRVEVWGVDLFGVHIRVMPLLEFVRGVVVLDNGIEKRSKESIALLITWHRKTSLKEEKEEYRNEINKSELKGHFQDGVKYYKLWVSGYNN